MTNDPPVDTPRTTDTTGMAGRISLVGIGPGHTDHMTARARAAIAEADVVVGYVTYIKLVADLLDGKEVVRKGMTEELDRAVHALAAARAGKKVALISSGDAGVYGMAGPTYEVLFQAGWTPEDHVAVEIVPGAAAINACAALVGAPLTHDFCSISLSDLLTPWPVIARRLDAAAAADFVVALYNPKSGRRTRQIVEAQRLFLRAGAIVDALHPAVDPQQAGDQFDSVVFRHTIPPRCRRKGRARAVARRRDRRRRFPRRADRENPSAARSTGAGR